MTQLSKQPDWEPESCYSCGLSDLCWIAKHEDWAYNVCGAAQFKPKTPEEIQARQQREAREELASAMPAQSGWRSVACGADIACWGRANDRNWNPTELRDVIEAVEQFLHSWERHE